MSQLKPVIDSSGKITLYPEEGLLLPIIEKDPVTNLQVDISTLTLLFKLKTGFSKALVADPEDPLGRRVLLTREECEANVPNGGTTYVIVDESGEVPNAIGYGSIGWEGGGPWTA